MPRFLCSSSKTGQMRVLDVRADDTDARDCIFEPSLQPLPDTIDRRGVAPIRDQGKEGACVGFALAAVINISLRLHPASGPKRKKPNDDEVSPRMLYEMGRRYDEWNGEKYEGTSLRGAMKGWHKHGVASIKEWPYKEGITDQVFTPAREVDALRRPIGAYYRIIDSDVSHLQAGIMEADAVLASAWVHSGWQEENLLPDKGKNGIKRVQKKIGKIGLHAFAIIGYTRDGFIIQNSWGKEWGTNGYALLSYDDWFENRQDSWVARPGTETLDSKGKPRIFVVDFGGIKSNDATTTVSGIDINPQVVPYLINTGDKGALSNDGTLTTRKVDLPSMAQRVLTTPTIKGYHHIVLYAHGGLNSEIEAAKTADRLWSLCQKNGLGAYFFIWESGITESILGWLKSDDDALGPAAASWRDAWETLKKGAGKVIREAQKALGAGLSPFVREIFWGEMKGRAEGSSKQEGGACLFVTELFQAMTKTPNEKYKIHLVGHSAGSIYLAYLYKNVLRNLLANPAYGNVNLESISFMAPAISINLAQQAFLLNGQAVPKDRFVVYMLKSKDEENDSIQIYPSSLLTYVANHLEDKRKRVSLLGIRKDFSAAKINFAKPKDATVSIRHSEFDDPEHEVEEIFADIA